jgi:hypothetical protein
VVVFCEGRCTKTTTGTTLFRVSGYIAPGGEKNDVGRTLKTISIEVDRLCATRRATLVFDVAFSDRGPMDRRRRALNGNGIADGKERAK